jgi:8-amino-7-oxononanoate synthase
MPTSGDPFAWIDAELARLERAGLRRRLAVRRGPQRERVVLNDRGLINFGCNDYLGLAADERVIAAARAAMEREGLGSGASPLVSGRSESHAELERRLAEFEGTEAALVFPSGFAANAGIISALVDEGDAIFGDAKNHASVIDGCRLSKARRFIYPHLDHEALERLLRGAGSFRRRLIVADSLFSMDGDLAPLVEMADLAEKYDAMLMVDEAHATGVFGAHGRGVVEYLGSVPFFDASASVSEGCSSKKGTDSLHDRIHIRVGTLSKALGCAGGFVCGSQRLIDWLANRTRSYVFSTAQPPMISAAAIAALGIVRDEPQRRAELLENAANLRQRLSDQGWNTGRSASQIIPLIIGDAGRTMLAAERLREAGFFLPGIRPPSVPEGESLLRLSLCFHHRPEMIDALLAALARLR